MVHNDDLDKNNPSVDDILKDAGHVQGVKKYRTGQVKLADNNAPGASEVYEESEEGVVYSPTNPGSEQQMREAKKILEKENRKEQA